MTSAGDGASPAPLRDERARGAPQTVGGFFAAPLRRALARDAVRRFRRDRAATIGLGVVVVLALFAAFGPLAAGHHPDASDFTLTRDATGGPPGPSARHWLGTDPLFRDLFARLAHGARLSLFVAVTATAVATALGTAVGVAAGLTAQTRLGAADSLLMRLVDVLLALPFLLFVTAIGVAVGRADVGTVLFVLGLTGWTTTARVVRAKTMQIRELEFVVAARALGAGPLRILWRHVLPNLAGTVVVIATATVSQMILAEAVLGYLGVGVQPPRATWGRMLHEAEHYLGTRPLLVAAPGFAILLAVLGFSRVGEGLRDALDPHPARSGTRRGFPLDLAIALSALLLVAGGSPGPLRAPLAASSPASPEPVRGGWLRVATMVGIRTLDPALAYDEASAAILDLVYPKLVAWDASGRLVPDLARDVTISGDGRTYTFVLRDGVRFHDGAELVAADVKRSLERTLHPKTPSPAAAHYASIVGFEAFHAGKAPHLEGVRVLDRRTVAIELREPDATFLPLMSLAFAAPVCPSSSAFADASKPAEPCGAGPFRVVSYDADRSIRLARHQAFHRPGRPYLDGIEWLVRVRPATQRYKLEDGEIDYARDLSAADAARFRADARWAGLFRLVARKATNGLFLNTELPPFDRRAFRRAVARAIDPSVLEKIRPDVSAIDRVLPESIPGPPRDEPMRRHDLAEALDELARAGYPFDPETGRGGYPGEIDLLTIPETFDQQAAEVFQQQLARIGIRVRLRLVGFATYLAEASRRRATAMGTAGWTADFPDAANFFESLFATKAIADDGSQNYAFFSDARLDRLLERARAERDPDRRAAMYGEAERIVRDEAPWVPTYVGRVFEIWQPYVRGYEPHAMHVQRFHDVWLDAAAPGRVALGPTGAAGIAGLGLAPAKRGRTMSEGRSAAP